MLLLFRIALTIINDCNCTIHIHFIYISCLYNIGNIDIGNIDIGNNLVVIADL